MNTIVVFATKVALKNNNGYGVAFGLYRFLAASFDIKVIVPCSFPYIVETQYFFGEHMTVYYIGASEQFCMDSHLTSSKLEVQFAMLAENDSGFVKRVQKIVGDTRIIICDSFVWVPFVSTFFSDRRIILRSLDIEKDKLEQIYTRNTYGDLKKRKEQEKYIQKITVHEKKAYQMADHVFVLTENDRKRLCELYEVSVDKIETLPLCVDEWDCYHSQVLDIHMSSEDVKNIVFVGYLENDEWHIMDQIVSISDEFPEIQFHVIGKVNKTVSKTNMTVYGEVDKKKKEDILTRCDGALNLTTQTYGMNAKVLDYIRFGCQIIANENGVRGYKMTPRVHYYPIELDNVREGIISYINSSRKQRLDVSKNAYKLLSEQYEYGLYKGTIEAGLESRKWLNQDKNKDIYVFGCGEEGKSVVGYLRDRNIECKGFIDNDKSKYGKIINGLKIYPVSIVLSYKKDAIRVVIATRTPLYAKEMYTQLINMGVGKYNIDLMIDGEWNPIYVDYERVHG